MQQNQNKIDWFRFSRNESIFELDFDFFHQRMNVIRGELMAKTWHPNRFIRAVLRCLSIDDLEDLN